MATEKHTVVNQGANFVFTYQLARFLHISPPPLLHADARLSAKLISTRKTQVLPLVSQSANFVADFVVHQVRTPIARLTCNLACITLHCRCKGELRPWNLRIAYPGTVINENPTPRTMLNENPTPRRILTRNSIATRPLAVLAPATVRIYIIYLGASGRQ